MRQGTTVVSRDTITTGTANAPGENERGVTPGESDLAMTRRHTRKQAIRERMATTGEPYTVARRRLTANIPTFAEYPYLTKPSPHPWHIIPLGIGYNGREITINIDTYPGVLIGGVTGAGKSVTERVILAHVLSSPAWRVAAIDLKDTELHAYAAAQTMLNVATTLDEAIFVLEQAEQEMLHRYALMVDTGVTHFRSLPAHTGPWPALLIVIDELYALLAHEGIRSEEGRQRDAYRTRAGTLIGSLARLGRAAGIHLVMATQRPDAAVLKDWIKGYLTTRIACGRMDRQPSRMILDGDNAAFLPWVKGRQLVRTGTTLTEVQGYLLNESDIPALRAYP